MSCAFVAETARITFQRNAASERCSVWISGTWPVSRWNDGTVNPGTTLERERSVPLPFLGGPNGTGTARGSCGRGGECGVGEDVPLARAGPS